MITTHKEILGLSNSPLGSTNHTRRQASSPEEDGQEKMNSGIFLEFCLTVICLGIVFNFIDILLKYDLEFLFYVLCVCVRGLYEFLVLFLCIICLFCLILVWFSFHLILFTVVVVIIINVCNLIREKERMWEGKWEGYGRIRGRGNRNYNLNEKEIYFQF